MIDIHTFIERATGGMEPDRNSMFRPSMIYDLLHDPFKVWCEFHAPKDQAVDEVSRYDEIKMRRGVEYENAWVAEHCPGFQKIEPEYGFQALRNSIHAMMEGLPAIHAPQLWLLSDGIYGKADVLVRDDGASSDLGNFHYRVLEIKRSGSLKEYQVLQAAFYNRILGRLQGYTPESFTVVLRDGEEEILNSEVDSKIDEMLNRFRRIRDGVVRGIAHYGNCFGVPTVGGEVMFEPCYSANPLVNALALGIARQEELFFAKARGAGNPVIYVGARTGRDGIHGASLLASAEFTEESQQKRPNVQVGDPFMEKLLLEACLEAMQTGAVVAIQDMGAAGLTCSTCEMASRGGMGIEIELAKVPQRETGMTPYEIMLSESQERMLLVAERGREREVLGVFAKWGLDAVEIGRVTDDGLLRVRHHGEVVAEIPAHPLAEEGPVYQRPVVAPAPREGKRLVEFADARTDLRVLPPGAQGKHRDAPLQENFQRLLASPAIASKRWVWEQ